MTRVSLLRLFLHSALWTVACTLAPLALRAGDWPLTGALGAHDPSVVKEGNTWWCFTTGRGLPVKYSSDGYAWQQGVALFTSELSWWRTYAPNMGSLDVWAPDIQRFGNRYYCYYCVSEFGKNNSAIGLMSCTSIAAGDWRDDGFILSSKAGVDAYNAIDPHLTTDAGGNPWLVFGSWFSGIQLVQLDATTMKPKGAITTLASRPNGIEGPNLVYANGFYYLFVSIDTCCQGVNSTYKIAYGRATTITGPYLDKSGVAMTAGGLTVLESSGTRWKGPGGQDVYQNGNAWVIARHAYDALNNGTPTLLISDLYWDSNYWPTFTAPDTPPSSGGPTITTNPVSQTVPLGSSVTFTVAATGSSLSYAWRKNGVALPGATGSSLTLSNVQNGDSGDYTVMVSNGSAQTTSAVAILLVDTPKSGRLINLSVRTRAGTGSETLIAGFIVSGSGTKPVMVRGTGPTLSNFGVSGVLADPFLSIFRGDTSIFENNSWATAANQAEIKAAGGNLLGAYTLDPKDTILLTPLAAGPYTAQLKGADGGTGVALVEVFDTDTAQPGTPEFDAQPRLTNISARSQVGTGDNVLIAGFIINGNVPKRLLIRGTGPTLANFGVSGVLTDPILELHVGSTTIAQNDNWGSAPNLSEIRDAGGDKLGAFVLDGKDAVLLVTLVPGAYTAVIRGVNNVTGVALMEVFELP